MVVPAARNAIDLALEQVPAGVSVEQFLVALFRLNPGAFAEGKIHQLSAGAHLQLPTAEQARALTQERARTELQTLRQAALAPPPSPPSSAADAPATSGSSSTPADVQAGAPQAAGAEASPPAPMPAATTQALPAAAQVQALPIHPWLLISSGGALLILLFLAFRPSEQPRKPPAAADAPAPKAAASGTSPSRDAASSAPVPKSLADFGPLPSLDLEDGPGSGSTRATPQAPAPFDLSRISLDLNPEDKRPS